MVVRMRHNRSQVRQRRSHHALTTATLSKCSNCGASRRPHHMCLSCGFYNGRMVVDLKSEGEKRTKRMTEKKERVRGESGRTVAPKTEPDTVAAEKTEKKSKKILEKKTGKKAT